MSPEIPADISIWVLGIHDGTGLAERLGDAWRLADRVGGGVGAIVQCDADECIAAGADVVVSMSGGAGPESWLRGVSEVLGGRAFRLLIAGAHPDERAVAARFAVQHGAVLISPALLARPQDRGFVATAVHPSGGAARQVIIPPDRCAVLTMADGVAVSMPRDPRRTGTIVRHELAGQAENVRVLRTLPADPATADIRHVERLIAGGRGVGGADGFDRLRRVAALLEAGVAASRVAVDLGWIEHARQVGQTGKTVQPDLYLACGISGASHHLDGMSASRHIVAINADADAPVMARAHLALVADLHTVLEHLERALS